ncbi:MAG TPA: hypothetical protein VGB63_00015, partial [Pedobacter sp.]
MKTYIKLLISLTIFAAFFQSCKKNEDVIPKKSSSVDSNKIAVVNGRLHFKDRAHLEGTYHKLTSLDNKELEIWKNNLAFSNLADNIATSTDPALISRYDLPMEILCVLNVKGEVQYGDTIVWYNNGTKHFIPKRDESLLKEVKQNPSISKIKVDVVK